MCIRDSSITDVAQTVKEGGRFVVLEKNQTLELEKLLHFEPYAMLGERILWELFDDDKPRSKNDLESMNLVRFLN